MVRPARFDSKPLPAVAVEKSEPPAVEPVPGTIGLIPGIVEVVVGNVVGGVEEVGNSETGLVVDSGAAGTTGAGGSFLAKRQFPLGSIRSGRNCAQPQTPPTRPYTKKPANVSVQIRK